MKRRGRNVSEKLVLNFTNAEESTLEGTSLIRI